jgi:hypothetical protein
MTPDALSQLSAPKLAAAIARGETTRLEATQACPAHIAAVCTENLDPDVVAMKSAKDRV